MSTPTYTLTTLAARDLADIHAYIAADNPAAADRVVTRLRDACRRLGDRPSLGRPRRDIADPTLRSWTVKPHVIVFRSGTAPLQIMRVLHGRRDFTRLFKRKRRP